MLTDIREEINGAVIECVERANKLDAGSEARAREIKNATALLEKLGEDYKVEEDLLDKRWKMEEDNKLEHRKLDVEEERIEMESKSRRRVKPDTILNCLTLAGLTIGGAVLEAKGYRLPKMFDSLRSRVGKPKD